MPVFVYSLLLDLNMPSLSIIEIIYPVAPATRVLWQTHINRKKRR